MTQKEIVAALTDELIDCGVLVSSVMIDEEQIIGGEAYTEPTYYEIDPLEYAPLVRQELIHRRARGQLSHDEFKEALEALDFEIEAIKKQQEEASAIIRRILEPIHKIGEDAA